MCGSYCWLKNIFSCLVQWTACCKLSLVRSVFFNRRIAIATAKSSCLPRWDGQREATTLVSIQLTNSLVSYSSLFFKNTGTKFADCPPQQIKFSWKKIFNLLSKTKKRGKSTFLLDSERSLKITCSSEPKRRHLVLLTCLITKFVRDYFGIWERWCWAGLLREGGEDRYDGRDHFTGI